MEIASYGIFGTLAVVIDGGRSSPWGKYPLKTTLPAGSDKAEEIRKDKKVWNW